MSKLLEIVLVTNTPQPLILTHTPTLWLQTGTATRQAQTSTAIAAMPTDIPSPSFTPVSPTLTDTSTPTPSWIPTSTHTPSPTPTPTYVSPMTYDVGGCMNVVISDSNQVLECVSSVMVLPDGKMQFNFSWTAHVEDQFEVHKSSDRNNTNIYLTDNLGNRYDHVETGGDADRDVTLINGQIAEGWFIFPAPLPEAENFILHDDDNSVQTSPIPRVWP